MNKPEERDYKRDIVHRLLGSGIRDERFIEEFLSRHEVVRNLRSEDARGPAEYEEELEHWVIEAEKDYESMWLGGRGHVKEGKIRPQRRQRSGRANSVAGAWERQEALARYLAHVASEDGRVVRFRKDVLSGHVLSEAQAMTFLSSPIAAADNQRSSLEMLNVHPLDRILDTSYEVEERQDDWGPYKKLVWGRRRSSTIRPLLLTARPIYPGDNVTQDDLRFVRRGRAVVFPHPRAENRLVVAGQRSFIEQIVNIVEKSLGGYPISKEMGVWFVLTGKFIPQDPVRIHYVKSRRPELHRTTITLEVEGWLPPEEVLEQYRHAQDEILGKRPRSLKRDTLAVFEFVNEREGKSWRELYDNWNEEHPTHQRFKDRSHLYTSYNRAIENIANVKPEKKTARARMVSREGFGSQIFAKKWYILHSSPHSGYTGSFESREEALADPRSKGSEVVTSEELVARRENTHAT